MSNVNRSTLPKRKRVLTKKNHSHQVSHLFPFLNQNESVLFISNVNLHLENNVQAQPPNNILAQEEISNKINIEDIKIESRVFPVLTKSNGFPRIIQEVKIYLDGKTLTLTNMSTNLKPSTLSDEYFSQIASTLSPHGYINEYKIDMSEEKPIINDAEKNEKAEEKIVIGNNFLNIADNGVVRKNEDESFKNEENNLKNEDKLGDLLNTLVNKSEKLNEDEGQIKRFFTIKKKITK